MAMTFLSRELHLMLTGGFCKSNTAVLARAGTVFECFDDPLGKFQPVLLLEYVENRLAVAENHETE